MALRLICGERAARPGSCAFVNTRDRIEGVLLGTAFGDALGLTTEGMSAKSIARRFGRVDRYHLLGRIGFVSDDTEQSALVAQSLARHPDDPATLAFAGVINQSLLARRQPLIRGLNEDGFRSLLDTFFPGLDCRNGTPPESDLKLFE